MFSALLSVAINDDGYGINRHLVNNHLMHSEDTNAVKSTFLTYDTLRLPHKIPQFGTIIGKNKDNRLCLLPLVAIIDYRFNYYLAPIF